MRVSIAAALGFAAMHLLACATEQTVDSTLARGTHAIVDGERETAEDAVVAVFTTRGSLCTGTLIAPNVVLTAKHCVQEASAAGPSRPNQFIVGIGSTTRRLSDQYRVSAVWTTPGVWTDGSRGIGGELIGIDVAILTLSSNVSGVTPKEISFETATRLAGQEVTVIGFGETPAGEVGIKYRTTASVQTVMGGVIYTGASICEGDSGGPMFDSDGKQVGVTSFGNGSCGSGYGGFNRVDRFQDDIQRVVAEAGTCIGATDEICDGRDNDCDEEVDETCSALGSACAENDECVGQTCSMTPVGKLCTQECDPTNPTLGCPNGLFCAQTTGCAGLCVPGTAGTLGSGESCTRDTECETLRCVDPGDGNRRCLTPCQGDKGTCFFGEACVAYPDGCGACVDAEVFTDKHGIGEPCEQNSGCWSDLCLSDLGDKYCSRACESDGSCVDGFHCRDGSCVRGAREGVGSVCVNNQDCTTDTVCARRGDLQWCTSVCDVAVEDSCPSNFTCVEAGGTAVCAPVKKLLGQACEAGGDCVSGTCADLGNGKSACTKQCGVSLGGGSYCGPGFVCEQTADGVTGACVAVAVPRSKQSGCAVGPLPGDSSPAWGFGIVGLLGLAVMSRRRAGSRASN